MPAISENAEGLLDNLKEEYGRAWRLLSTDDRERLFAVEFMLSVAEKRLVDPVTEAQKTIRLIRRNNYLSVAEDNTNVNNHRSKEIQKSP